MLGKKRGGDFTVHASSKRHRCEQESLSVSVQSRKSGGEVSSMQQRVSGTRTSFGRRQDKADSHRVASLIVNGGAGV